MLGGRQREGGKAESGRGREGGREGESRAGQTVEGGNKMVVWRGGCQGVPR